MQKRLQEEASSRQVFLTTHSTQITAAAGLDPIICMTAPENANDPRVCYPARVFGDEAAGKQSRKYIERYLDATKSNMLFTKGVIFVEGLAEILLLLPCLAEYAGIPLEEKHVTVIAIGGSTFKHFLPLFGAGTAPRFFSDALHRRVACVVDCDPTRKERRPASRHRRCWPYQLQHDLTTYEYFPESGVVTNLRAQCQGSSTVKVFVGSKTLEYDLALANATCQLLVTSACDHADELRALAVSPGSMPQALRDFLGSYDDQLELALAMIPDATKQQACRFATCYLLSAEERKGVHAFDLENSHVKT